MGKTFKDKKEFGQKSRKFKENNRPKKIYKKYDKRRIEFDD